MSIKISPEERILDYFQTTDLATANAIFRLVRGYMKKRNASENAGAPAPVKRRKKRTPKPVEESIAAAV